MPVKSMRWRALLLDEPADTVEPEGDGDALEGEGATMVRDAPAGLEEGMAEGIDADS
jgi:hypothetical protein